jgi:hypothetical protein
MASRLLRPLNAAAAAAAVCLLAACDGTEPRVPTSITISPSSLSFAALGETQDVTATVLDQDGNALDEPVAWSSSNASVASIDSNGVVQAVAVGSATVIATAGSVQGSAPVSVAQLPASISLVSGDGQVAGEGVQLADPIVVLVADSRNNPAPGVSVTFTVTSGGGSVSPSTAATGANGQAQTTWTMGSLGPQTLTATASAGGASVSLPSPVNATAAAGTMSAFAGSQVGLVGFAVNVRPAVRIVADTGPLSGINVTFAVASGGGSISGATATTNSDGVAQVGSWTLGATAGTNELTATASGFAGSPITFSATGQTGTYNIVIQNVGPPFSAATQTAFDSAVAKWQRIIYQDVTDQPVNIAANACGFTHPAVNQTIDDILILTRVDSIDGPGNVLGQAGFCVYRNPGSLLPSVGVMVFDSADVAALNTAGQLRDVILHEMGHSLGYGTLWPTSLGTNSPGKDCLRDPSSSGNVLDTYLTCASSRAMFDSIGGTSYTGGNKVPVENCGPSSPPGCGAGTVNSHWREPTFDNELMTGYLNSGVTNPLSRLSAASMEDLGYVANYAASDPYVKTFTLRAAGRALPGGLWLGDDVWRGPLYQVDPSGRVVRVARPGGP